MHSAAARAAGGARTEQPPPPRIVIPSTLLRAIQKTDVPDVVRYLDDVPPPYRQLVRDVDGRSLVHLACLAPAVDILYELISESKRHYSVQVVDLQGWHPLHTAASVGAVEHMRLLLQAGANPLALNGQGQTPADVAEASGFDFVATFLRDAAPPESSEHQRATWAERVPLISASTEAQLAWRELEQIALLTVAVPITPLPWDASTLASINGPDAKFVIVKGQEEIVAGMLSLSGEFQLDGMYFRLAIDALSPHGTGARLRAYESLAPPRCLVECVNARLPDAYTVVRLITAEGHDVQEIAPELREPLEAERAFLNRCGPSIRQTLLTKSLKQLGKSAEGLRRAYRQYRNLGRFRTVMLRVAEQVSKVKTVLKRNMIARRLCIVALAARLKDYEQYCRRELDAVEANKMYSAMAASLSTSTAKRTAVIQTALSEAKRQHKATLRAWQRLKPEAAGPRPPPFRYAVALHVLIPCWVAVLDTEKFNQLLLRRDTSYLPHKTIMALQKRSPSLNINEIARSRIGVELRDILPYYQRGESYGAARNAQFADAEVARRFKMEETSAKMKEQRKNAAVICDFLKRQEAPSTRRFRSVQPPSEDGAPGGSRTMVHPEPEVQLVSISDIVATVPPPNVLVPKPPENETTSSHTTRRREPLPGWATLVCTSQSPIPQIIGSRSNVRKLLVTVTESGERVRMVDALMSRQHSSLVSPTRTRSVLSNSVDVQAVSVDGATSDRGDISDDDDDSW
jgi:hypothetical protein